MHMLLWSIDHWKSIVILKALFTCYWLETFITVVYSSSQWNWVLLNLESWSLESTMMASLYWNEFYTCSHMPMRLLWQENSTFNSSSLTVSPCKSTENFLDVHVFIHCSLFFIHLIPHVHFQHFWICHAVLYNFFCTIDHEKFIWS